MIVKVSCALKLWRNSIVKATPTERISTTQWVTEVPVKMCKICRREFGGKSSFSFPVPNQGTLKKCHCSYKYHFDKTFSHSEPFPISGNHSLRLSLLIRQFPKLTHIHLYTKWACAHYAALQNNKRKSKFEKVLSPYVMLDQKMTL